MSDRESTDESISPDERKDHPSILYGESKTFPNPKNLISDTEEIKAMKAMGILIGIANGNPAKHVKLSKMVGGVGGGVSVIGQAASEIRKFRREFGTFDYDFGNHGSLELHKYKGRPKTLSDGATINPGDLIADMSLTRNIKNLRGMDYISVSRILYADFLSGMISLADQMKSQEIPQEVVAITGISHMASPGVSKRFGFDIEEPNISSKLFGAWYGSIESLEAGRKDEKFSKLFRRKYKRTHQVWMSRQQVIDSKPLFEELLDKEMR